MPAGEGALVIVPTYNERDNIGPIAGAIHDNLPGARVLFVDDNSPDGTGELAEDLARRHDWVRVLHREGKLGLGTAYLAGFRYGLDDGAQLLIEMDADFSHDPRYLPEMVRRAERADVVVGSRYTDGGGTSNWGLGRRILSRGGSLYARTVLGIGVRDVTAGFICYRRNVLQALDLDAIGSQGYGFQIEMKYRVLKAGFRIEEMPIVFTDRRIGQSKMSRGIVGEALGLVWRLRLGGMPGSNRTGR